MLRVAPALGLVIDGYERSILHKAERSWRIHGAVHALLGQMYVSGFALRIVVGHLVSVFLLRRCFLSCRDEVWRFIDDAGEHPRRLPRVVVRELLTAAGLLLVTRHVAHRGPAEHVYISDASEVGYSLLDGRFKADEVLDLLQWKERSGASRTRTTPRRRRVFWLCSHNQRSLRLVLASTMVLEVTPPRLCGSQLARCMCDVARVTLLRWRRGFQICLS